MPEREYPGDSAIERQLSERSKLQEMGRALIFGKRTERRTLFGDYYRELVAFSVIKFSEPGEKDWYQLVMQNSQGEEIAFGFDGEDSKMSGDDGKDYLLTREQKEFLKSVAVEHSR